MHVATIIGEKGNAVYTIEPGQMISDAVEVLSEKRIGALVVVSAGQVDGILSERDIMHALHISEITVFIESAASARLYDEGCHGLQDGGFY